MGRGFLSGQWLKTGSERPASPGLSVRIATRGTGNLTRAGACRVHSDLEFIFRERF